jgi:transcriptional regulator with PAS, ATPase and Fis domain
MSSSTEPRAALVSIEDQGTIMALINIDKDNIGNDQLRDLFIQTQEVLMQVAQYSQPIREVQMVCKHPQQIIDLQWQITDLQTRQYLPQQCDHTELEQWIRTLTNKRDEARMRQMDPGTDEELRQVQADMTQDARQSGEEVRGLRTQFANALMLAARAAPATPLAPEDRGQKFPYSLDFSGSD